MTFLSFIELFLPLHVVLLFIFLSFFFTEETNHVARLQEDGHLRAPWVDDAPFLLDAAVNAQVLWGMVVRVVG